MSTNVYGDRDFKGNIVRNAAVPSFGNISLLNAFTPPFSSHFGHQAWVEDEKQPYWWDGTSWKTIGGGGEYYGVRSTVVTTPDSALSGSIGDQRPNITYPTINTPLILMAEGTSPYDNLPSFDKFSEISTGHPLWINLKFYMGFVVVVSGVPQYNRKGLLDMWVYLTSIPSSGTDTTPTFYYYTFTHGWEQSNTNILDGRLGAAFFDSPTKDAKIPVFPSGTSTGADDNFTRITSEWVDLHTSVGNGGIGNTDYRGLAYDTDLPAFLFRPIMNNNSGNYGGLRLECKSFPEEVDPTAKTYIAYRWAAGDDGYFQGGAFGNMLTYWF